MCLNGLKRLLFHSVYCCCEFYLFILGRAVKSITFSVCTVYKKKKKMNTFKTFKMTFSSALPLLLIFAYTSLKSLAKTVTIQFQLRVFLFVYLIYRKCESVAYQNNVVYFQHLVSRQHNKGPSATVERVNLSVSTFSRLGGARDCYRLLDDSVVQISSLLRFTLFFYFVVQLKFLHLVSRRV